MSRSRVVAVDLPWSAAHPDRTAVAVLTPSGAVSVSSADARRALPSVIADLAEPDAHILLDIPIGGCSGSGAFRPVDRRLAGAGIPLLPWTQAADRGVRLAREIRARLPQATVDEVYPYAVFRVLWALHRTQSLGLLRPGRIEGRLERGWSRWPPRYKRARTRGERLAALSKVRRILTGAELALSFDPPLPRPAAGSRSRLTDCYDAALAIIPGVLGLGHPAVYRESDEEGGAVILLADSWLRGRLCNERP